MTEHHRMTRRRWLLGVVVSAAALAAAMIASLLIEVEGGLSLLRPWADDVSAQVFDYRWPRVVGAAIVGAGLAAAGGTFQAVLRNPLAEPYTLGVSSGSALAAVVAIHLGLDQSLGYWAVGFAALMGAGATVVLVWRLGKVGRELPPATLLLAGITIAMFCAAATMLLQALADFKQVYRIMHWMMGGLYGTRPEKLLPTAIAIGVGIAALLAIARDLNALAAGTDAAASVGVNPQRTMTFAFFTSSLIVGACIALAGPIGFVGLLVPHAVRAVIGPDHRALLPISALAGGALLVVCDAVAREGGELPTGIITALIGGPFFLYLLLRQKGRARLWGGM